MAFASPSPSPTPSHASEIEQQLKEQGSKLLHPPSAVDDLLNLLEIIEQLLIVVDQAPSRSMQQALIPCMMGLIAADILRHPDMDVKVSVAFCITEITRITAPDPPYNDEQMKEVFHLAVATFENFPHASGHSFKKMVSILDTVSRVKSCLMMLDLELDDLITRMFKQFLEIIGSSHSRTVFSAMETIMTYIINESDDLSLDLVTPILESVKKEKQDVSPLSCKLAEKVIMGCAAKLKPYLVEAVKSMGTDLDDYAQIIANTLEFRLDVPKQNSAKASLQHSLQPEPDNLCPKDNVQSLHGASKSSVSPGGVLVDCNNTLMNEGSLNEVEHPANSSKASEEQGIVEKQNLNPQEDMNLEMVPKSIPKKRGRKPKSVKKPEEGHDHSLVVAEKRDAIVLHKRKSCDMEIVNLVLGLPAVPLKKVRGASDLELTPGNSQKEGTSVSPNQQGSGGIRRKRGRPKKTERMMQQDVDPNSASSSRKYALTADLKEEVQDAPDVGSEKDFKDTSDSKEKPWRRSKKIEGEALAEGDVASEKGAVDSSAPKKKLLQKSSPKDIKKNSGAINSCEDHTEISHSQKLKSAKNLTSTPQRKRSGSGKKKAYEIGELDGRLVGKRIKIWWPLDKTFYDAVIESFNQTKKRHKVLYTDGDVEVLNLYKQRWKLMPEDVSPDGERTDNQVASPSPTRVHKKRRRKSKSADGNKVASSSRRDGGTESVTAVEAGNPGDRTLTKSRIDHSNIDGSAVGTYRDSKGIKDYGANFGDGEKSEKEFKDTSDSKEKPWRHTKKIGRSSQTGEEEALAEGDLASGKGADGSSAPKKKLLQKSCPKDIKKNYGSINSHEDHIEISQSQKLKSTKTPTSTHQRKRSSSGKKKTYEMGKLDERLVGKRIKVWWPMHKMFQDAVIESFDRTKKRHKVLYTDGNMENLNLNKKRWELIPEDVSPDGERTDNQVASPSPTRVSKKRRKSKSVDGNKVASSSRRVEVSESVTAVEDGNPGDRTLAESRIDDSNIDGSAVGTFRNYEKIKDDVANSGNGEKLDDGGVRSGECGNLKDDGANSGRSDKLKDDGVESMEGEQLKDDSVISKGGEKADDKGLKSGECEKLKDDGANSGRFEKSKYGGVESIGGDQLKNDNVISKEGEKLDDNGVKSVVCEKLQDDGVKSVECQNLNDDNVKSLDCEKLNDDGANSEIAEKSKDDVMKPVGGVKLKDCVISEGGDQLDDNGVKSGECEYLKDDDSDSGKFEKSKDDGIESLGGEKLKDESIKSGECENLDDNGLKSGEAEKLRDDGSNYGSSEKSKDDGIESAGGEKLEDDDVKFVGGEKLDDNGVESGKCEELKDDGADSEKSKDYGNKSAGGEKLKDKSLESEGGEKLDDKGVKCMEAEKLKDIGANSERFDKLKDDGIESVGGEKLSDDSANSSGGEKLKDNGVKSEGGEKLKDGNANSGKVEKLDDNGIKSVEGEKCKDDVVKSTDMLKEEVLINSMESSNRKELSNSGEDECCSSKVNLNEGKSSKYGDELKEERLDNIKQSTPRTETASEVGHAGEVIERDEEKSDNSELTKTPSADGVAEDVTGVDKEKLDNSKQTASRIGTES